MKRSVSNVLRYSNRQKRDPSVPRRYKKWLLERGEPFCCAIETCGLHKPGKGKLTWNGKDLGLIVDHINGVWKDSSPQNLRLLCPNCDSQQRETRGGANRGRVLIYADQWYLLKPEKPGKPAEYRLFVEDAL
jgi:hypothetical protein